MPTRREYAKNIEKYKEYRKNKERIREINKKYLDKVRKFEAFHIKGRVRNYGITPEAYKDLLLKSEGKCALCKRACDKLVIDHNHDTGNVRSLLCYSCNSGLGHFGDNIAFLLLAIDYLEIYDV